MHTIVEVAGKKYPISFGQNALAQFGRQAGLSLSALNALSLDTLDLLNLHTLIWCGMKDGFRKARKSGEVKGQFEMEVEDVADLLDEDPEAVEKILGVFSESMPEQKVGNRKAQRPKAAAKN